MFKYPRDWCTFHLESWMQRGALHQLLIIAVLIGLVAGMAGTLVLMMGGNFPHPAAAIWWAFLRLTDPGYLGDDEGLLLRTVSTVVTVLGYVLFMGSLIAIMTQWLNAKMRTLESGLTPISIREHILILGWTNRTAAIVHELVSAKERAQRFLRRRGVRTLRIVILAEHVSATLRLELRDQLGKSWRHSRIIFRSGSSLRSEHLRRVNAAKASVILVPGADFALGGVEANDTRVVKTLMSLSSLGQGMAPHASPRVVAEIFDVHKTPVVQYAYQGALDVVPSDAFVSRLIAQNVRHRGLSYIYAELISHTYGNEVYVRNCPQFAGLSLYSLMEAFTQAILLGLVRCPAPGQYHPLLNPADDVVLMSEDRLVFLARHYDDTVPRPDFQPAPVVHRATVRRELRQGPPRRVLFLGWSHKVHTLLQEFSSYAGESFQIDLLSVVPSSERAASLGRYSFDPDRIQVRHLDGDYTLAVDLLPHELTAYDNIVFLGSDWLESGQESDARTVLGYVLLRSLLPSDPPGPEILVELMDPDNARLFLQRPGEVIISPLILSHMLAHMSLRRELSGVFDALFGSGGSDILFRPVTDYNLSGQTVTMREVQHCAASYGEIALGIRQSTAPNGPPGGVYLNPPLEQQWLFSATDEVVVLA